MEPIRNIYMLIIILSCSAGLCIHHIPLMGHAQPSNATAPPGVSIPAHLMEGPVPGALILGYVLDEDGKPVPMANVSLWQDGRLWQTKFVYYPSDNPQRAGIAYTNGSGPTSLREGGFLFGFASPGEYTLVAEKGGYRNSSVNISVGNETMSPNQLEITPGPVMVNITLRGYRMPALTPAQRAYTGAIIGNTQSAYGYGGDGYNVSLWQDGRLVDRPDNPQMSFEQDYSGKKVDYAFDHLAPGHYTVMAQYFAGGTYNDTASVDVNTTIATANIRIMHEPPPPLTLPDQPGLADATPAPLKLADATPAAPVLPELFALLSALIVAQLMNVKKRGPKR